jgi:hypothetical protein
MEPTFLDIHNAILDEAKLGIPFSLTKTKTKTQPTQPSKPKFNYCEPDMVIANNKCKKIPKKKKTISVLEAKNLIQERKKAGCSICKYNRCLSALEFHHKKPEEKSFAISKAHQVHSLEELIKELDKCILVCSNCHKEIHAHLIKI